MNPQAGNNSMSDQVLLEGGDGMESVLERLLEVGATLYASRDQREMLETVLTQARSLTKAEAGSLYLVQDDQLQFVAVQNDRMHESDIDRHLLGKQIPISSNSLAGFVASTAQIMNIPDSFVLPPGAPFTINRELDAKTGYRVTSILAIPLNCPDGKCIGVLQLFNCVGADGKCQAFPDPVCGGIIALASTAAISLHNVRLQRELRQMHLNSILRLATIAEYRDADTSEHVKRVSQTSEMIAGELGLPSQETELLKYASAMHDVGKVAIPDAILLKPGPLTPSQRQVMEQHTLAGADIFRDPEDEVLSMARDVALNHHERWDGQGYPNTLSKENIPICGRIVGLADVFDAVVSHRCYKPACRLDVALDVLDNENGKHFDPVVFKAFMDILDNVLKFYPELNGN
ncbi:MAG: HD domain-containing protein [Phycisphaerae bacterium]|nr:HD domain-containing protein [Phycisphaerae bacterium]